MTGVLLQRGKQQLDPKWTGKLQLGGEKVQVYALSVIPVSALNRWKAPFWCDSPSNNELREENREFKAAAVGRSVQRNQWHSGEVSNETNGTVDGAVWCFFRVQAN
ncbi:uncharacterized protein LOC128092732 [Culex pipiens pallens]|uniref:uncharacterized protein LOC128092732 n=1 Tax=Culex pipiens pallens TaxID=42434 RepID=UPI0022AA5A5B|nr:uncharacterized protein LOC128092732 [Culex pipiens pallens]